MSEIRYVNRLGDALDLMVDTATAPGGGVDRRSRLRDTRLSRLPRGRSRLLVGLAVLLVGGGVATAATLLSQSTTVLVTHGLNCDYGPPNHDMGQAVGVEEGTRTPTQACAAVERVPAAKLIGCASAKLGVVVYDRNGSASECESVGMAALPSGYARATKRVATLIDDLNRLQASQNCFTPSALVAATQSTLDTLDFRGWHVEISRPAGDTRAPAWRCAQYPASGLRYSDAASAVSYDYSDRSRIVAVVSGPSRQVDRANQAINRRNLYERTGARCYSLSGIQALVRGAVLATFGARTPVTFAAAAAPRATGALGLGRQARYAAGCAILVGYGPTPHGGFQAQIWQQRWPAPNPSNDFPQSAYRRVLHKP
jgi:hypothetical protein